MNLASRCREAISHVAMLKKELAMHQRRAAEALALQRQQVQKLSSDASISVTSIGVNSSVNSAAAAATNAAATRAADMGNEMDNIDRLMAAHAPPPPPPNPPASTGPASPTDETEGSPTGEFYTDYGVGKSRSSGSSEEDVYKEDEDLKVTMRPMFPHSASPRVPSKTNGYNEGFPNDLPVSSRKKKQQQIFRQTPPEISEADSEAGSQASGLSTASDTRTTSIMSSIDAFEASFATNFPENFSSSPSKEDADTSREIYNPFLPSPNKDPPARSEAESANAAIKIRSAPMIPTRLEPRTREASPTILRQVSESPSKPGAPVPVSTPLTPSTPPHRSIHEVTPLSKKILVDDPDEKTPRTPPSLFCKKVQGDDSQPKRPEKTVSASARAKYEKALQPRGFPGRRAGSFKTAKSPRSEILAAKNAEAADSSRSLPEPEPLEPENTEPEKNKAEPESESNIEPEPGRIESKSSKSFASPRASQSPSLVLKRLQARRARSGGVSPEDKNAKSSSSRGLSTSQSSSTPTPTKYSTQSSSPVTSRSTVPASPFPKTQPSTPETSTRTINLTSKSSSKEDIPSLQHTTPDTTRQSLRSTPNSNSQRTPKASTDTTPSPSVLSAISVFEKASKQNKTPTTQSTRPAFRSSFGSPNQVLSASPADSFIPSDEEEGPDQSRPSPGPSAALRDFRTLPKRSSSDDEDWSHPRPASARELQSLAKRGVGDYRGTNGDKGDNPENLHNSFPSRINNYTISQSRPIDSGTYTSPRPTADATSSKYGSTLRNSRRNVKQPLSYSEPSINSKLRRGDVYFTKEDGKNGDELRKDYAAASVRL